MPPCSAPKRPAPVAAHLRSATMLSPPEADLVRRDGVLPGLATVLDPDALLAALAPALPAADVRAASVRYVRYKPHTNCLVAYRPELWAGTLQPLRYKPERRHVARLEPASGAQAVLKVHAAPRYERAAASAAAFRSCPPLRVPRLLGRGDAEGIVALEWLTGRLLAAALADGAVALATVTAVGAALGELHSQRCSSLPTIEPGMEAAGLLDLAADLAFLCPDLARAAQDLAGRLAARLREPSPARCPIHGDFYAEQVLLDDAGVAIFDLDRAALGDPAADLGTFIAHLEREALRGGLSADRVPALREALLEGYRAVTRRPPPPGVDFYTAVGLFRIAPEPFRGREPDWPDRIAAVLARANGAALAAS